MSTPNLERSIGSSVSHSLGDMVKIAHVPGTNLLIATPSKPIRKEDKIVLPESYGLASSDLFNASSENAENSTSNNVITRSHGSIRNDCSNTTSQQNAAVNNNNNQYQDAGISKSQSFTDAADVLPNEYYLNTCSPLLMRSAPERFNKLSNKSGLEIIQF